METLKDFEYNGYEVLKYLIKPYGTINQAVASLSVFTHPHTVRQIGHKSLFSIIRAKNLIKRGDHVPERSAIACDNTSAQLAFCWANGWPMERRKGHHLQFNHIYDLSNDPKYYTSLANICVTPTCIAKLTDGKTSQVKELLKYHIWSIYDQFLPEGMPQPVKPIGYDELKWADYPEPIDDVETVIKSKLCGNPRKAVEQFGWLPFSLTKREAVLKKSKRELRYAIILHLLYEVITDNQAINLENLVS